MEHRSPAEHDHHYEPFAKQSGRNQIIGEHEIINRWIFQLHQLYPVNWFNEFRNIPVSLEEFSLNPGSNASRDE